MGNMTAGHKVGAAALALTIAGWAGTVGYAVSQAEDGPVMVVQQGSDDGNPAPEPGTDGNPLIAENYEDAVALCYYYFIPETGAWDDCVLAADAAWPVEESESLDS